MPPWGLQPVGERWVLQTDLKFRSELEQNLTRLLLDLARGSETLISLFLFLQAIRACFRYLEPAKSLFYAIGRFLSGLLCLG